MLLKYSPCPCLIKLEISFVKFANTNDMICLHLLHPLMLALLIFVALFIAITHQGRQSNDNWWLLEEGEGILGGPSLASAKGAPAGIVLHRSSQPRR